MASALLSTRSSENESAAAAVHCPLCGGGVRPWLTVPGDWRRPRFPATFRLAWCDDCRYGLLAPRPSRAELSEHYQVDEYYTHRAPQQVAAMRTWLDRLRVHLAWRFDGGVESEIDATTLARRGIRPPAKLCDVGCGNGGLLNRLARSGYDVTGIEPDDDARHVAQAAGFRVFAGSGETLPADLADEHFDVVTMTHVLEHCLDPAAAVRNIAGLLADDGLFFVETPNNDSTGLERAGVTWRWLDVPRHLNFFTADSLRRICELAGLSIVDVEYTGFTRQVQHDWIAEEQEIHQRLSAAVGGRMASLPPRNSSRKAFRLLAATCGAAVRRKYDSVRVIARKGR